MPESDTVKIWTMFFGLAQVVLVPLVGGVVSYLVWRMTQSQAASAKLAATTAEQTNLVRDVKLEKLADTANATHTLVNSQMGATLKAAAIALRTVADLRGKPADIAAAEEAERLYGAHQAKQDLVDAAAKEKSATVIVMGSSIPQPPAKE
jgi:hypothetical protein